MENKAKFTEAIGEALRNYSRESVVSAEYIEAEKECADSDSTFTTEIVRVTFQDGYTKDINVNCSSCLAIMCDIYKNLI